MEDTLSEWQVRVVRVGPIEKHPNADTLGITKVDEYPVLVKLGEFNEGDKAVYIPVDSVVPDTPAFKWLDGHLRIRAKKLRGTFSMGLLTHYTGNASIGDIVDKELGITKWLSPAEKADIAREEVRPKTLLGKVNAWMRYTTNRVLKKLGILQPLAKRFCEEYTDLASGRKVDPSKVFDEEECVSVTEKIHGTNFRAVYRRNWWGGGKLMVGSHHCLKNNKGNVYWEMAKKYNLEEKLKNYPGVVIYGEVYGDKVQDLTYGCKTGERRLVVFDVMENGEYLTTPYARRLAELLGLEYIPIIYYGGYYDGLKGSCEGLSTVRGVSHIREGVVIKSEDHKYHQLTGRKAMKLIGQGYLLRKDADKQKENFKENMEMFQ